MLVGFIGQNHFAFMKSSNLYFLVLNCVCKIMYWLLRGLVQKMVVMISKEPTELWWTAVSLVDRQPGFGLYLISFPCVYIKNCEFWFARAFCCVSFIPSYGLVI